MLALAAASMLAGCQKTDETRRENSNPSTSAGTTMSAGRDNSTGNAGTANWRLPIYHYDDYENWEVMQYYDIPSHYEIPSEPEMVTAEKAGEVYYSEPNRIILFYQDGEVTGEYTKIGTIEDTGEFREAVESNPVLEGWGNKIVLISSLVNLF